MRSHVIKFIFGIYRYLLSPAIHLWSGGMQGCRFTPSCSEYSKQALLERGLSQGSWITLKRLLRCNPFCRGGYDPVP